MSSRPPIIAYHIIIGAYGFWLPNDPRGSWSRYVWSSRLLPFGPPVARARHDAIPAEEALRSVMKEELLYPPVRFTGLQARAVGRGFADIVHRLGWIVSAAAIMPDHVHLVIARKGMYAETMAGHLKRAASRQLRQEELHPMKSFADKRGRFPSPWERNGWKVFLHSPDEIELAVLYVNQNPEEAGLPAQRWPFVTPYRY
jgi:REP element-mobilizing transposase RayT